MTVRSTINNNVNNCKAQKIVRYNQIMDTGVLPHHCIGHVLKLCRVIKYAKYEHVFRIYSHCFSVKYVNNDKNNDVLCSHQIAM